MSFLSLSIERQFPDPKKAAEQEGQQEEAVAKEHPLARATLEELDEAEVSARCGIRVGSMVDSWG